MRIAIALALCLAITCQSGASVDPNRDETVDQAFARFIHSFNRLEWKGFRRSFASDVSLFNPDVPDATSLHRLDGRERVEANFRAVFEAARRAGSGPRIVPTNVSVQRLSDVAVVTFEFERGSGSFGRRTLVFARQSTGWKIIHIHASNVIPR